jgi:DNA-binding transcriptional LysR family regulator
MDTFAALTVFVRAAETGSFSAAARLLGLTPSAVSRSVTRLERELDARLLHRSTHAIALTEVGETFFRRASAVLRDLDDAREQVSALESRPRGTLRVDASVGFGQIVLGPLLPVFLAEHRDLRVELTLRDRTIDPVAERMDVVIRVGPPRLEAVTARKLTTARLVVCGAPSYFERRGVPRTPADLARHECLDLVMRGRVSPWRFQVADEPIDVVPQGRLACDHGGLLRDAALAGAGLVRLLDLFVAPQLASGALRAVLDGQGREPPTTVHALQPSHRRSSAKARAFVDFLVARLAG